MTPPEAISRIKGFVAARRKELEGTSPLPWLPETEVRIGWEPASKEDAAFIASARSSVPVMLDALEAAVREWDKTMPDCGLEPGGGDPDKGNYAIFGGMKLAQGEMLIALASSLPEEGK